MMDLKKTLLPLLLFSLFSGCVEDVLIDVDPAPQKMVVSSLFIPDSIVIVTVTRSFSALSGKDIEALGDDLIGSLLVDQGRVTITSKGETDTLRKVAPGIYIGSISEAKPLDLFELNVFDSSTQQLAHSITQLKPQVRFDSVAVSLTVENEDTTSTLYYEFQDSPEQENWYLVQGFELPNLPDLGNFSIDENGDIQVETQTSNQFFFAPDIAPLFTDLIADITQETNTISSSKPLTFVPKDTLIFILINIDEGYFDFLQARKRSGGILSSLTREPVNHPSNVENGYGYFTMHLPHFKGYIWKEE